MIHPPPCIHINQINIISKNSGYYHYSVEDEAEVGNAVEFLEDEDARIVFFCSVHMENKANCGKWEHTENTISKLHSPCMHHALDSNRESVNSVVEKEAEGGGVVNISGMFAINLVQYAVNEVTNRLPKEPPRRNRVLGIVAHGWAIHAEKNQPRNYREKPATKCDLNNR